MSRPADAQLTPSLPSLLILGSHIFAEEVADLVTHAGKYELAGFVENQDRTRCNSTLLDKPVHWIDEIEGLKDTHFAVCAIGSNARRAFIERIAQLGFKFATVQHPSACISSQSSVGSGCAISAGVIVATSTQIAEHTILNRGVLIGHHTRIGRFVTVSPGANIAGCVTIGDGAYVGMGAVVLDRIDIGPGALIGAGAVVTKNVAAGVQVMGVPARVVREGVQGR